jgi:deoxyribonuclease-4
VQIGAHVSVSGGYEKAVDYALEVGCECIQVFAKSPRQWRGHDIVAEKADAFVRYRAERELGPVFTHTAYLINLATPDAALRSKSIAALADELRRGRILDADGVITHAGSGRGDDPVATQARVIRALEDVLSQVPDDSPPLLLENTAGAGDTFGASVEQLCSVICAIEPGPSRRVGFCLDTCHAHAAGIPVSSAADWAALVETVECGCGVDAWRAVHANDCIAPLGSHKDRHAWIGDGTIGLQGFEAMLHTEAIQDVPVITEMPGEVPEKDAENISRLKTVRP